MSRREAPPPKKTVSAKAPAKPKPVGKPAAKASALIALTAPPTSADVGRRAGVSRTTVSFVLNGVQNQGISEATREKVLVAARELGYEPHAAEPPAPSAWWCRKRPTSTWTPSWPRCWPA